MLSTLLTALLLTGFPTLPDVPQASTEQSSGEETQAVVSAESSGVLRAPANPLVETLFVFGGRIYLGNSDGGVVEALLIENGRVVAAGTEKRLRVRLPEVGVNLIDLKGAVAVPGIQDAHAHVERLGRSLDQLDLRGVASYAELVTRVAEVAEHKVKGEWIVGAGWDQRLWEDGEFPNHAALSKAVPNHPVLLWRVDGFTSLVNAKALELAKLNESQNPPPRLQGGRVLVDENKMATGVLVDRASRLVTDLWPKLEREQREGYLLRAQDELVARGVTCVHDMSAPAEILPIYESLRERGLLKVRVIAYVDGNDGLSAETLSTLPRRPDDLDMFSVPGVNFHLDGDLGTHGAALIADYSDAPGDRGHLYLTEERLTLLVLDAWRAGLQPAVRAVGDRANRIALDTYERMMQVDEKFTRLRPRIEHAQVISARDIPRFPELQVIPSMQPNQSLIDPTWIVTRLGPNRSRGTYAWRSLAPGLMELAFGSGAPFGDPSPIQGIYAARMRRSHEDLLSEGSIGSERLDGFGALAGYTRGPAHAAHQEDRRGQLVPGFWADLTVFDQNPVVGVAEELPNSKVLLTIVNGRIVYQR